MIKCGESPEDDGVTNKFIAKSGGHRGVIIAISRDAKEAWIIVLTKGYDVRVGDLFLVREEETGKWPVVVARVDPSIIWAQLNALLLKESA